ncbi:MAG: hypothetical protein JWO95_1535 [Verrucomicrobiales bacterium]|nr:hypothetical protein [Verrucomicrobiales bacterium]
MKTAFSVFSHPYIDSEKEPKDRQKGRTTLLGVGWPSFFCRWTANLSKRTDL